MHPEREREKEEENECFQLPKLWPGNDMHLFTGQTTFELEAIHEIFELGQANQPTSQDHLNQISVTILFSTI